MTGEGYRVRVGVDVGGEGDAWTCIYGHVHACVCVRADTCVHVVLPGRQSLTLTLTPSRDNIFYFLDFLDFLDRGGV